jgi:hypothetical protein
MAPELTIPAIVTANARAIAAIAALAAEAPAFASPAAILADEHDRVIRLEGWEVHRLGGRLRCANDQQSGNWRDL